MDGINAFFWTLTYILWIIAAVAVISATVGTFFAMRSKKTPTPEAQPTLTLKRAE